MNLRTSIIFILKVLTVIAIILILVFVGRLILTFYSEINSIHDHVQILNHQNIQLVEQNLILREELYKLKNDFHADILELEKQGDWLVNAGCLTIFIIPVMVYFVC